MKAIKKLIWIWVSSSSIFTGSNSQLPLLNIIWKISRNISQFAGRLNHNCPSIVLNCSGSFISRSEAGIKIAAITTESPFDNLSPWSDYQKPMPDLKTHSLFNLNMSRRPIGCFPALFSSWRNLLWSLKILTWMSWMQEWAELASVMKNW